MELDIREYTKKGKQLQLLPLHGSRFKGGGYRKLK